MKRRALALLTGLLLMTLVPGSALAATAVLDQSDPYGPGQDFSGALNLAQTFTAGKTGTLTSVDLYMGGSGSVTVTLEGATNGILDHNVVPIGATLATATSVPVASMGWVKFSFASPYAITSGNFYSIIFNPGSTVVVGGSPTNYVGGRGLVYYSSSWVTAKSKYPGLANDWAFRTWVKAAAPKATPKATPTAPKKTPTATHTAAPTATLTATDVPTASPTAVAAATTTAPAATATPVASSSSGSGSGSGSSSGSSSGGSSDSTMLLVVGGIVVLGLLLGGVWFLVLRPRGQSKV